MEHTDQKNTQKKEWLTPELRIITGFDVHENVATTYIIPRDIPDNTEGL